MNNNHDHSLSALGQSIPIAHRFVSKERPVRPGASISNLHGDAGTATLIVKRRFVKNGALYLLSCEHVLRPKNSRTDGQVVQPAVQDGIGSGRYNVIGEKPIVAGLSSKKINFVDAAIVRLNKKIKGQNLTNGNSWPIISIGKVGAKNTKVTMVGRSSGVTEGAILNPSNQSSFDYSAMGWSRPLQFAEITKCNYLSGPGDSGAPVFNTDTGELIGLHIGGGPDPDNNEDNLGYFCPIQRVFETLNIELI